MTSSVARAVPKKHDFIGLHAQLTPDRAAAVDLSSGEAFSFGQLDALIERLGAGLIGLGCAPGDRVAVIGRNSVAMMALHFACIRSSLVLAPLNWRLNLNELHPLLDLASPRLVIGDTAGPAGALGRALGAIALPAVLSAGEGKTLPAEPTDPDRVSLILFTSGTSGKPKGVALTERNLMQIATNFALLSRVEASSAFLCDAPMFHIIGIATNIWPVLRQGGRILVSDGFDAARTLARLCDPQLGVSHYVGVPQMIEALRRVPGFEAAGLRKLTALVSGGAPHDQADIDAWLAGGVPLVLGFGMTEGGTIFGMPNDLDRIRAKPGSVGVEAPTLQTRVVDELGADCRPGEIGELWLRGESVSPGYWRDPEATAASFSPDGWFRTGDLARYDEEGFFWIVGRLKDMFISGGENVYPSEIELALVGYRGLREYAVIGVPDPTWGEVGRLFVAIERETDFDAAAVLSHLRGRLASYKVPKQVTVVEALPRTPTGKILTRRLRELCE